MKIVKNPVFPVQKCKECGCEFKIKKRDLKESSFGLNKTVCCCPVCKSKQRVDFGNK